jgi:tRNA A37 N6-isopentenylltransferase MiaA
MIDPSTGRSLRGLILMVHRERKELYALIDARVHAMMDAGWIEEVAQLPGAWRQFLNAKKIIGYHEIIEYQANNADYESLVTTIQQRTRNYAKQQIAFLHKFMRNLDSLALGTKPSLGTANLTLLALPLYIKQLANTLHWNYKGI